MEPDFAELAAKGWRRLGSGNRLAVVVGNFAVTPWGISLPLPATASPFAVEVATASEAAAI